MTRELDVQVATEVFRLVPCTNEHTYPCCARPETPDPRVRSLCKKADQVLQGGSS